jgi:hypothetical protein
VKKCAYCGREYPDAATLCLIDQQPLKQVDPPLLTRPAAPPPPSSDTQRVIDDEHLKMLSIFHYVVAGLAVLGIAFLFLHFALMSTVFFVVANANSGKSSSKPPPEVYAIIIFFYLVFGCILAAAVILNFLSARFLRRRVHRNFSLVTAGLNCLHVPFGTVLGVFTFIVLMRPSVRQQYHS